MPKTITIVVDDHEEVLAQLKRYDALTDKILKQLDGGKMGLALTDDESKELRDIALYFIGCFGVDFIRKLGSQ